MGLMDFFKKGVEKPVEPKTQKIQTPPSMKAPEASREYTIERGDTLSNIAKKFYGNAGDWKKIYEANKNTIKNPDLIYPGEKIIIP
ncbi:MAG: LysM peptidoglycan-binding domain-containing protein [Chitinophagales bacterium]|nr:LysM peptidoglycan-binding domain-containing protein [Chitinophagales bacterium]